MPKSSAKTRTRTKQKPASVEVEVVIEDDAPSVLEQVQNLETTTLKLIDKIDYKPNVSNDTVGEALSLAREAIHIARTRLEKNEQKAKQDTPKKPRRKAQKQHSLDIKSS